MSENVKQLQSESKILIIDDDKMNGELTRKKLERRGFTVELHLSAMDFLQQVEDSKLVFDLVLLDIMMPDISGLEVLNQVRKKYNSFDLPIILVTSKDEADDIVVGLKEGANDYITKPVNIDIASARINTQLKIKELLSDSLHSKQISTINTMVTTLNHEINNPLAIAIGNLTISKEKIDHIRIEKALKALERITQIVKKIEAISQGDMEEVAYSTNVNMYKLK